MAYFLCIPSRILQEVIRNFDQIFWKTFSYFCKILSQKFPKNFPIFLTVSQVFLIFTFFFKICSMFAEYFSVLQNFFEILPKTQKYFIVISLMFLQKIFKIFLQIIRSNPIIPLRLFQKSTESPETFRKIFNNYCEIIISKCLKKFSQDFGQIIL